MTAVYAPTITLSAIVALATENLYAGATDYQGTMTYDPLTETLSVFEGGLGTTAVAARKNADSVIQFDYPDFDNNPAEVYFGFFSDEPDTNTLVNSAATVAVFRNALAPFEDVLQVQITATENTLISIPPPVAGTRVTVALRPLNGGIDFVWDGYSSSIGIGIGTGIGTGGSAYAPEGPQTLVTQMLAGSLRAVHFYENIRPLLPNNQA